MNDREAHLLSLVSSSLPVQYLDVPVDRRPIGLPSERAKLEHDSSLLSIPLELTPVSIDSLCSFLDTNPFDGDVGAYHKTDSLSSLITLPKRLPRRSATPGSTSELT